MSLIGSTSSIATLDERLDGVLPTVSTTAYSRAGCRTATERYRSNELIVHGLSPRPAGPSLVSGEKISAVRVAGAWATMVVIDTSVLDAGSGLGPSWEATSYQADTRWFMLSASRASRHHHDVVLGSNFCKYKFKNFRVREKKSDLLEEFENLGWFFESQKQGREYSSSQELMLIINGMNKLMKAKKFHIIDMVLKSAFVENMSPQMIVAFSRTVFSVRSQLSEWRSFVRRAKSELEFRSLDAERLLKGL
jgi:hypothetical protein